MALFVVPTDRSARVPELHLGAGKLSSLFKMEVFAIQADGDELDKIHREFTGIPKCNNRVVTWHGEFANFIYHNLTL